jgi:ankyrin repeat protein
VELLISKGATVDIRDDNFKQTALHVAVANNRPKLVEILLKACPSMIDAQDADGKTALFLAAENDNVAIGKLLLAAGAKVELLDKNLDSPLHAATNKGGLEFGRMLLGHKLNPNIRNREGNQPSTLLITRT